MGNSGLQPVCLFIAIFPSVLCLLLVSVRVWQRWTTNKYAIEDTLLVIATILNLFLSFTTSGYIITAYIGYHVWDIPKGAVNLVVSMKWNYANSVIYNPILALIKVSFLLSLIKLRSQNKRINICLWATLVVNACFAIAAPLACIFQCRPVERYWDRSIAGSCISAGAYTVGTASIVLATDALILIMPSWILYQLRMPLSRKIMVIAFLSFGIGVTIVGAYRTSILVRVFVIGEIPPDPTYSVNYTLSNIESALAIIGVCGPTIKYILGLCIPAFKGQDGSNDRHYNSPPASGSVSKSKWKTRKSGKDSTGFTTIDEVGTGTRDWNGDEREQDEIELKNGITKTVAWGVEGNSSYTPSTTGQEARARTLL